LWVGTSLSLPTVRGPDLGLVESLVNSIPKPVIAEGRYEVPADTARALELGAYAVAAGTAITRPQVITERFVSALDKKPG
jgi:N-acylglucosamine-6-phosphate 2-epimerase